VANDNALLLNQGKTGLDAKYWPARNDDKTKSYLTTSLTDMSNYYGQDFIAKELNGRVFKGTSYKALHREDDFDNGLLKLAGGDKGYAHFLAKVNRWIVNNSQKKYNLQWALKHAKIKS
jgi:hypothetical protein